MKRLFQLFTVLLSAFVLMTGVSACAPGLPKEAGPLKILVDIPCSPYNFGGDEEQAAEAFSRSLETIMGIPQEDVEVEFLPKDSEDSSKRLAALKTEWMAGGGPDVLILSCNLPWGEERETYIGELQDSHPLRLAAEPAEKLLLDPQSAMNNHMFLSLDEYLETARYYDPDFLPQAVMDAGKAEDGHQYLLPLTFTFPTAIYQADVADRMKAEECAQGAAAWNHFPDLFGKLADYKEGKLLFTEEELLETVHTALGAKTGKALKREDYLGQDLRLFFSPEETGGLVSLGAIDHLELQNWTGNYFSGPKEEGAQAEEITPVKNREGGVTAQITSYLCINKNTQRPEDAFKAADFFFKKETMGRQPEYDSENKPLWNDQPFLDETYGIPIRNDLMGEDGKTTFGYSHVFVGQMTGNRDASAAAFQVYSDLRSQVTTARFYGSLDEELQNMFNQCREADSDEEIEKIVSRTYETMTIMLGE